MPTSKRVAKKASRVLTSPKASKAQKSVAASDLAQAKGKPKAKAAKPKAPKAKVSKAKPTSQPKVRTKPKAKATKRK